MARGWELWRMRAKTGGASGESANAKITMPQLAQHGPATVTTTTITDKSIFFIEVMSTTDTPRSLWIIVSPLSTLSTRHRSFWQTSGASSSYLELAKILLPLQGWRIASVTGLGSPRVTNTCSQSWLHIYVNWTLPTTLKSLLKLQYSRVREAVVMEAKKDKCCTRVSDKHHAAYVWISLIRQNSNMIQPATHHTPWSMHCLLHRSINLH